MVTLYFCSHKFYFILQNGLPRFPHLPRSEIQRFRFTTTLHAFSTLFHRLQGHGYFFHNKTPFYIIFHNYIIYITLIYKQLDYFVECGKCGRGHYGSLIYFFFFELGVTDGRLLLRFRSVRKRSLRLSAHFAIGCTNGKMSLPR